MLATSLRPLASRALGLTAPLNRRFSSTNSSVPLVVNALGADKVGIMAQLSGTVTKNGGNVESGRMTKLGSDFCVMMLVTVPASSESQLSESLKKIDGIQVIVKKTNPKATSHVGGTRQRVVKLSGTDQPGILHGITEYFAKNNINVDDMITYPESAAFSGTPLFHMRAVISLPPQYNGSKLESDIAEVGDKLGVDVWVESVKPPKIHVE